MTRSRGERGTAALEFVLVLPFVFLILVLFTEFAAMWLARHRALVAARELGLRHVAGQADTNSKAADGLLGPIFAAVRTQVIGRRLSTPTRDVDADPDSMIGIGPNAIVDRGRLNSLARPRRYTVAGHYRPMVGTVLPGGRMRADFFVVGHPWTYKENPGGYLCGILRDAGKFGEWLGIPCP